MKTIKAWLKKNYIWVAAGASILFAILAILITRSGKDPVVLKQLDIAKERQRIANLEGKKEVLAVNREKNEEAITLIDTKIQIVNDEINRKVSQVDKMTLKQKVDAFDDLEY